ncbi:MAG: hypothetical protein ACM3SV_10980 [Betaproteobacteria bacterium]
MSPFGIFPFNMMPMFNNPWFPLQAKEGESEVPPMMKAYMEGWAAWAAMMNQANPWFAPYSAMLENNPFLTPQQGQKKKR